MLLMISTLPKSKLKMRGWEAWAVFDQGFSSSGTHHTVNYQPAAGGGYIGSFIGTSRIIDSDEAEEITRNVWSDF